MKNLNENEMVMVNGGWLNLDAWDESYNCLKFRDLTGQVLTMAFVWAVVGALGGAIAGSPGGPAGAGMGALGGAITGALGSIISDRKKIV